jgi:hypothetical protein
VKNLVNRQHLRFTETWRHSKFVNSLWKIRWEKYHTAFVKVVEGSEIYNFPIHHPGHFSWEILSYTRSNRDSPHRSTPERERARRDVTRALCRAAPRCTRHTVGPRSHMLLSEVAARPESPKGIRARPVSRPGAARAPPDRCPWRVFPSVFLAWGTVGVTYIGAWAVLACPSLPTAARRSVHPGKPWPMPLNSTLPSIPSPANTFGTSHRPPKNYPHCPLPFPGRRLAGARAPAATAAWRRGPSRQQPLSPNQAPKSNHGRPWAPLLLSLGRTPVSPRRNFGRTQLRVPSYFQGLICDLRVCLWIRNLSRGLSRVWFSNSTCELLNLVKSVENRRKIRKKCKLNFVGFVVKNPTTIVILAWAVSWFFWHEK